ncbi:MAG: DUF1842 domain-containing protein [Cyanobacteriota bacterium]
MQTIASSADVSNVGLYLLNLLFTTKSVGSGSMNLALTVNAVTGVVHGQAQGKLLAGTSHPSTFSADASGVIHSTGLGTIVRTGAVKGLAFVSLPPPEIGSYQAPFSASFSLDAKGNGKGQFTVGSHTYHDCDVSIKMS